MFIVSLLATASAAPLHDVAQIELSNARDLHRAVRTAEAMERMKVSEECQAASAAVKKPLAEARSQLDGKKAKEAYVGAHGVLVSLQVCARELAEGPKSFQSTLKATLRTADAQLVALNAHLGDTEDKGAKDAYGKAVAAKTTARAKTLAGDVPSAVADWYQMVEHIFNAVKQSS